MLTKNVFSRKGFEVLDSLGAAYEAAGRFNDAVKTAASFQYCKDKMGGKIWPVRFRNE